MSTVVPIWGAVKDRIYSGEQFAKETQPSEETESGLPWDKGDTHFYRESAYQGPWLVHFNAN